MYNTLATNILGAFFKNFFIPLSFFIHTLAFVQLGAKLYNRPAAI